MPAAAAAAAAAEVEVEEIDRRIVFSGPPRAAEAAGSEPARARTISGPLLTPAAAPEALRRASEAAAARAEDDDESIKTTENEAIKLIFLDPLFFSLFVLLLLLRHAQRCCVPLVRARTRPLGEGACVGVFSARQGQRWPRRRRFRRPEDSAFFVDDFVDDASAAPSARRMLHPPTVAQGPLAQGRQRRRDRLARQGDDGLCAHVLWRVVGQGERERTREIEKGSIR